MSYLVRNNLFLKLTCNQQICSAVRIGASEIFIEQRCQFLFCRFETGFFLSLSWLKWMMYRILSLHSCHSFKINTSFVHWENSKWCILTSLLNHILLLIVRHCELLVYVVEQWLLICGVCHTGLVQEFDGQIQRQKFSDILNKKVMSKSEMYLFDFSVYWYML